MSKSDYLFLKQEQQGICDGCLARDRRLAPVGGLRELFDRILNHDQLSLSLHWPAPHLCWECNAVLRNTHKFSQRVCHAQTAMKLAALEGLQENQYECQICEARLVNDRWLARHKRQHQFYKCNLCDSAFASMYQLKKHLSKHRSIYKCVKCGSVFARRYMSMYMLEAHFRERHCVFRCDHCGFSTHSKRNVTRHIYWRHLPDSPVCRLCPRACSSFASLARHQEARHPRGRAGPEDAYCVECDFAYATRASYMLHVDKKHSGEQRFECPECGKVLQSELFLMRHRALRHVGRTDHYCQECRKYFSHAYALRRHRGGVHGRLRAPRRHECRYCARGFTEKKVLVNHERTHTGERPYACAVCSAAFAQSAPLVTHARKQHGARGAWADVMREYRNIHVPT